MRNCLQQCNGLVYVPCTQKMHHDALSDLHDSCTILNNVFLHASIFHFKTPDARLVSSHIIPHHHNILDHLIFNLLIFNTKSKLYKNKVKKKHLFHCNGFKNSAELNILMDISLKYCGCTIYTVT